MRQGRQHTGARPAVGVGDGASCGDCPRLKHAATVRIERLTRQCGSWRAARTVRFPLTNMPDCRSTDPLRQHAAQPWMRSAPHATVGRRKLRRFPASGCPVCAEPLRTHRRRRMTVDRSRATVRRATPGEGSFGYDMDLGFGPILKTGWPRRSNASVKLLTWSGGAGS